MIFLPVQASAGMAYRLIPSQFEQKPKVRGYVTLNTHHLGQSIMRMYTPALSTMNLHAKFERATFCIAIGRMCR